MVSAYPKIETTKFNFISIKDQYFLGIAARTQKENEYINFFSQESDLISYVDVSKVGFTAPAVEIVFSFNDRKLFPYLSEKSIFTVSIGPSLEDQKQSTFNIISSDIKQEVEGKWLANIVGVYDVIPYYKAPKKKCYMNTSAEVTKQILQENFGHPVKARNVFRCKDYMCWIQPNESDYCFLHSVWLHSYVQDSIWLTAIDFEGVPHITNLRTQAKERAEILLTTGNTGGTRNAYVCLDSFDVSNRSTIQNSLGGYAQTRPIYNVDDARKTTAKKKESALLTDSNTLNKSSRIDAQASYSLQTSNVHSYYQTAPLNNRSFLNNLKCLQLDVSVEGEFVPVELLDYVVFKDAQADGQAQEDYSGTYMVGKLAHQIANKKIYTHITIWREAQNTIAASTPEEAISDTEVQVEAYQNKVDLLDELMTADVYSSIMQGYYKLEQKIFDAEDAARSKIAGTKAYKAYKLLDKKYQGLKSYITDVYTVSTSIINTLPFMDSVQEKLNSISIDTPIENIQSTVRSYLQMQKYTSELNSKITDKITSNAVYSGYIDVKSKLNQMTYTITQLQDLKVIGDLNEYIGTEGQGQ